MDRGVGAAVRPLSESDRKDLAIQALAGSETVSDLAARHGMSRKFVYQQTHKARTALDDAFSPATPDEAVLFELAVTKTWLRPQESPHFAFVFSQMTPNMAVKTGCSRSLAAKRSSSGSSLCSGMVGMS